MNTKGINGNNPSAIEGLKTARTEKADATKSQNDRAQVGPNVGSENFGVNLSPRAREIAEARAKATEIARNTPDIREDRVAELKKRIQSGEYKVDAGQVADGMMQEAIKDEIATRMHEEAKRR